MDPVLVVYAGNARTFVSCFHSQYTHVLQPLRNFHVYFYLKVDDPGPKGTCGWDYAYEQQCKDVIAAKIKEYLPEEAYTLHMLETDELTKDEILSRVKNINMYIGHLGTQATNEIINPDKYNGRPVNHLCRAMNCHYNLYRCGEFIRSWPTRPKYIIYMRPDLEITGPINLPDEHALDKVLLNTGPNAVNCDHLAIIPYHLYERFFFDRFLTYCTNDTRYFGMAEDVYCATIEDCFVVTPIVPYYIRRHV